VIVYKPEVYGIGLSRLDAPFVVYARSDPLLLSGLRFNYFEGLFAIN